MGAELPGYYAEAFDPFVALTAAAAATDRLLLGTGVCLLIQRDPIVTAKVVASLDVLSGGRVVFGVGAGWNRDEIENHGTAFATRWRLLRERVEAMRAIWTEDEAVYRGEFVRIEPLWSWPKPLQRPHPPILLGSNGPRSVERVLRYADGWIPSPAMGVVDLEASIGELRRRAAQQGRPRPSVTIFGAPPDQHALLEGYAAAGVDRVVLRLPAAPSSDVLPLVARHASLATRYS
jgi:probable F420-dependent oxidoreductase